MPVSGFYLKVTNLYQWQRPLAERMVNAISSRRIAVCAAPTGVGKTFICLEAIRNLRVRALVVCPKSGIPQWRFAAESMECEGLLLDIINPEQISKPSGCAYFSRKGGWRLPEGCLVVFDEFHRYGTGNTLGSNRPITAMAAMLLHDVPGSSVAVLSATLADSPLKMQVIGLWLGWHNGTPRAFASWCSYHACDYVRHGRRRYALEFTSLGWLARETMEQIRKEMGDVYIAIDYHEIPDFPEETREVFCVSLLPQDRQDLVAAYEAMPTSSRGMSVDQRERQLRARQDAEFCKARSLAEMAIAHAEDGFSVFVVVNFTNTRLRIEETLRGQGVGFASIHGGQIAEERQAAIDAFQGNKVFILVSMVQAGGVAISLHDVRHERQRVSLISPGYSAADLVQALGRIRRAGGTAVCQKIVVAADTIEMRVARKLAWKLSSLDAFNRITDADLMRK